MCASGVSLYYGLMSETHPPLLLKGTRVQYLSLPAEVVLDNDNRERKWGTEPVGTFVTIRFTGKTPNGWSKVQDVFASACSVIA